MKFFKKRSSRVTSLVLRKLEDRILFDAAMDAGLDPELTDGSTPTSGFDSQNEMVAVESASATLPSESEDASPNQTQTTHHLLLVDTRVEDYERIVDELLETDQGSRSFEVILIDQHRSGIDQITEALSTRQGLDAVHLVSHGEDGALRLGNTWLTTDSLDAHAGEIAMWGNAFTAEGDFLIYGCDLAESSAGETLIQSLAALTGTDVAASDDDTGDASRGGDWELEYEVGSIQTEVFASESFQAAYQGILAAGPSVVAGADQEVMIGESFTFNVVFDNTGTTTGFGPFIDLVFPTNGIDGVAGVGVDGITFNGASYLGTELNVIELVFPDSGDGTGTIDHPYAVDGSGAPLTVTGTAGDTLVVVELPFGSVTDGQPEISVQINAAVSNLADVAAPLVIQTRSGFRYGEIPTTGNATILSDSGDDVTDAATPANNWSEQISITPTLITLSKNYNGPEAETATGPNYEREYSIVVDIADGQTINGLDIIDELPNNIVLTGIDSVTVGGVATTAYTSNITSMTAPANNQDFVVTLNNPVTGTTSDSDVVVTFRFYVAEFDADSTGDSDRVIPLNGEDDTTTSPDSRSLNNARAEGDWNPIDDRDTATPTDPNATVAVIADPAGFEHELDNKAIAIQKSVAIVTETGATGATPGDTLEYTLTFQISDYFTFGDLVITDVFQDGQEFDFTYGATFDITDSVGNVTGSFTVRQVTDADGGEFLVVDRTQIDNSDDLGEDGTTPDGTDGSTTLTFDVSGMMNSIVGSDGVLQGGLSFNDNDADIRTAATGTIRFRTVIQEDYSDTFNSGDRSVDQGDTITNSTLTISGTVRENAEENSGTGDITQVIGNEQDTSAASIAIISGTLTKEVYAINGNTTLPMGGNGLPVLVAGDVVTYRITYTLPTSDVEDLVLTDFLPLPIFVAADHNADGVATDTWTVDFDETTLDAVSGTIELGANDTFFAESNITPTLTVNGSNGLEIFFGDYDDTNSLGNTIELYLSVTAQNAPTADGLFLTNLIRVEEGTTQEEPTVIDRIIQIEVTQPVLNLTKGIIDSNSLIETYDNPIGPGGVTFDAAGSPIVGAPFTGTGPGIVNSTNLDAQPIDANITGGIDANDIIRYAIVVENTGSSAAGAFDVTIQDQLADGFELVAGSVQVVDGTGATVNFTGAEADLFTTGITLVDSAQGAIAGFDANNGENIILVIYDVQATVAVGPEETLETVAAVTHFAGQEGGQTHLPDLGQDEFSNDILPAELVDAASLVTRDVLATKTLDSTSIDVGGNGEFDAVIGEIATYTVTFTIPEGTAENVTIIDTLDSGLRFVQQTANSSSNVTIENSTTPVISNGGRTITWDLGDVIDTDITDNVDGTITFTYEVVVANIGSNQDTTTLDNNVRFRVDGTQLVAATADEDITVVEPSVQIDTTVSVAGVANQANGDAGDSISFVATLAQTGTIDAFDLGLSYDLPLNGDGTSAILTPTFTVVDSSSTLTDADFEIIGDQTNGFTLQLRSGVDLDMLAADAGRTIVVTVNGTIASTVTPNQTLGIDPAVTWTSLNGDVGNQSTHWTGDTGERDGTDSLDNTHDYVANDAVNVTINQPSFTKSLFSTNETETSGSDVTIGERATFALLVTMPEGDSSGIVVTDLIPDGLDYLGFTIVTDAASSNSLLSADYNGTLPAPTVTGGVADGEDVIFTFGAISTVNDNVAGNNSFLILVETVVSDIAGNFGTAVGANQTNLSNTATIDVLDDGVGTNLVTSNATVIDVVEPDLNIVKNITAAQANAGDEITITLTVTNSGLGDAYDVEIQDILNSSHYDLNTVVLDATQAGFTSNYNNVTGTLDYTGGTIAAGTTATFTFRATLLETVATDAVLVNTANMTEASTLSGDVTGERDYTDTDDDSVRIREHSLAGFVYYDADNDGVKDGTEVGIQFVDVTVTGTDHLGNDVDTTVQTDASGSYSFTDLRPGTYTITQTQPAAGSAPGSRDYLDGIDTIGTPGGNTANDEFSNIVLPLNSEIDGANNNFGELIEAELSGFVYQDTNNNGVKDVGEVGLVGIDVTLSGSDDNGVIANQVVQTGADGSFRFDDLRPGEYSLTHVQITGNAPSGAAYIDGRDTDGSLANGNVSVNEIISSINVDAGDNGINYLFGEGVESMLSGYVFHDTENDGSRVGNAGLGGVTVTLTGTDDLGNTVNLTTTTSVAVGTLGYYEFTNLRPSDGTGYVITQTTPTGYLDGIDTIGSQGGTAANDAFTSVIVSDVNGTENNFGELLPSSLSGMVFNDKNNDGLFNGTDEAIQDVDVTLTGLDDLGNTVNITVQTLANGTYSFINLRPSDATGYTITETQPANFNDGIHSDGSLANGDNSVVNVLSSINLNEDTDGTAYNFAERGIGIAGTVFVDDNRDGDLDGGESVRIGGIRIELWDSTDTTMLEFTTTAADGTYLFSDRPADDYIVKQIQPSLYTTTSPNTLNVTLPLAGVSGVDFGEALWDIGDTIYFDADGNGTQDAGDPGLGGVEVTLTFAGADGDFLTLVDNVNTNTTTAADGSYQFTEQFNGNYRVTINPATLPVGLTGTQETDDTSAAIDGTSNITILDGDRSDVDFGFTGTSSIGDQVWLDINGDGTRQTGEIGLADVTVNLTFAGLDGIYGNDDDFVLATSTDANGIYLFNNLPAGDFRVSVDTGDTDLPADIAAIAGPDSILGTANVTLTTGLAVDNVDFGFAGTLSLGDQVFIDHHADGGAFDVGDGDRGIAGVTVLLDVDYDSNGTFDHTLTTTTDANGIYSFDSLVAGDYRVRVDNTQLGDYVITTSTYEFDAAGDSTTLVTLAVGADDFTADFGYPGQVEYSVTNVSSLTDAAQGGDVFTYEVTVTNLGERDGTGVQVIDTFPMDILDPAGMGTNDPGNSSWDFTTGELTWNVGDLDIGESETLIVTVQVRQIPLNPLADQIVTTAVVGDDGLNGGEFTLVNNIAPTLDELIIFTFDTFRNESPWQEPARNDDDRLLGWQPPSYSTFERTLRPLPVDPIFSGLAEPGTTLVLRIYDEMGRLLGDRQVVADTGGNWLATFPGTVIWKNPHRMEIEQVASIENATNDAGFNLRRYFHPAGHASLAMTERLTVSGAMRESAYVTIAAMHDAHQDPLQLGKNAHAYQLNTASTNVSSK